MRIKIHLENLTNPVIKIPIQYNQIIQAFIYNNLNPETSEFIHNKGFNIEKRNFKLFTFSRILSFSKPQIEKQNLLFRNRISIVVCSLIDKIIQELAINLIKKEKIYIGKKELKVHSLEIEKNSNYSGRMYIKTLSPITVYSTININNSRKTYFYKPTEKEFEKLIILNLIKKYKLFCELNNLQPLETDEEKIMESCYFKPIEFSQNIIIYKNTTVIAYNGIFETNFPDYLYFIALNSGLGSKNSQGFGCIKPLKEISQNKWNPLKNLKNICSMSY